MEATGYLLNEFYQDEFNWLNVSIYLVGLVFYVPVIIFLQKLLSDEIGIRKTFHWIIATEILNAPTRFGINSDNAGFALFSLVVFLAMFVAYFVLCIKLLNGKHTLNPLIKPLKVFAITMIIGMILNFTVGMVASVEASPRGMGVAYIIGCIPFIFLLIYLNKMKKIYPEILNGNYKIYPDIDENWPPEKQE